MNTSIKMHNHFIATLRDASTGVIKQTAKAYNVVLDNFYTTYSNRDNFKYLQLGTGTGQPRKSDTSLFARKYTLKGTVNNTLLNNSTLQLVLTATSPLGNTGGFTEVGFGQTGTLITHAMFTDAEGNPIVITQTTTDILEITAVAYITLSISDTVMKYPVWPSRVLNTLFTSGTEDFSMIPQLISIGLATSISLFSDTPTSEYFSCNGISSGLRNFTDGNDNVLKKNDVYRIGVDTGNVGFFNYLVLGLSSGAAYRKTASFPFCYAKFPNTSIFPLYTIENIPVGVGDGSTSQFNCPLDMFVPNSDVVRVNGVQKTRGVDYTIDSLSNHSKSLSVTPGCIAKLSTEAPALTANIVRYKFFSPTLNISGLTNNCIFTQNNPLMIELDDTDPSIGTKLNYITLSQLRTSLSSSTNAMRYAVYTLSYSLDGNTYIPATSITITGNYATEYTQSFAPITAKYWKLSVDLTQCDLYKSGTYTADTPVVQIIGGATALGYTGTGIVFTEPPAADSIIEMDLSIDRPYKSSNYVIDLAGTYDIGS